MDKANCILQPFLDALPGKAFTEEDKTFVSKALEIADDEHKHNPPRYSGEPYITHPLAVATYIIFVLHIYDREAIALAILHDAVEDSKDKRKTLHRIRSCFGDKFCDQLLWLDDGEFKDSQYLTKEDAAYYCLKQTQFWRVILVRLADRIHNLRTLHHVKSREKRANKVQETMTHFLDLCEIFDKFVKREVVKGHLPKEYLGSPKQIKNDLLQALDVHLIEYAQLLQKPVEEIPPKPGLKKNKQKVSEKT